MPTHINAVIIDDEPEACENLKNILAVFLQSPVTVNICGIAHNTADGERLINRYQPDIVFLDIEMPNENGFAFLERIAPFPFEVIFITAYDAFAVKAFKLNAIDYILKPIDIDDLANALKKAEERIAFKTFINSQVRTEAGKDNTAEKKILLRNGNDIEIVQVKQIVYIEADWSYSHIFFLKDKRIKKLTMSYSIAGYEQMLPRSVFYRIHKSYLVNTAHIKRIVREASPFLVLTEDVQLPVSRRRYTELISFLKMNPATGAA